MNILFIEIHPPKRLHLKILQVLFFHELIMSCLQSEVFIFPDSPTQLDLVDQVLQAIFRGPNRFHILALGNIVDAFYHMQCSQLWNMSI